MTIETQNQQPSINVVPNGGYGGGIGDMFGAGNGGIVLWFIIFIFMIMFMGWGNNNGNASGNGGTSVAYIPYMGGMGMGGSGYQAAEAIRQGFDQSAVVGGINTLQAQMQTGFNNAEVSRCNQQANILATMNANQNATNAAMQAQAMALQNCCCENRAGIADVKYALATEACADRAAVTNALQELTAQNNAQFNAMQNTVNNGIQSLKDDFCNYRIEQKDARIAELERQLTISTIGGMVDNSRNAVLSNNDLQTATLEQYLAPTAKPAYIVQNPNCCAQQNTCFCNSCGR